VAPPVPTLTPFNCHWYVGVAPPFVGVAVNVTEAPVQDGLDPEVIATFTEGVTVGLTVTVDTAVPLQPADVPVTV
jgi:hypothetical protein